MNILETKSLTIGYGSLAVQSDLNLSAEAHDLICLTGTNGAGKSTLLRTISGLQPALHGTVKINGKNIATLSSLQRATQFALVLTDDINIERLTVRELVAMGRFPYTNWAGSLSKKDNEIINKALTDVNLLHKADSYINQISDGEKQRAVIAKAISQDTPLVILDEPTAHLDLPNRIEIMLLLRNLSVTTGKTFILSTHELDIALQMADKIWLMTNDGIQVGIPEDLMLSGSFQNVFGSTSFYFDDIDGHCQINHKKSSIDVNLICEDDAVTQYAWMKRALIRKGINVTKDSINTIHCKKSGYMINNESKIFYTIQDLLERLIFILSSYKSNN